jgi:hypothetical protein
MGTVHRGFPWGGPRGFLGSAPFGLERLAFAFKFDFLFGKFSFTQHQELPFRCCSSRGLRFLYEISIIEQNLFTLY